MARKSVAAPASAPRRLPAREVSVLCDAARHTPEEELHGSLKLLGEPVSLLPEIHGLHAGEPSANN